MAHDPVPTRARLISICTKVSNLLVLATMGGIADQHCNSVTSFSQVSLVVAMVMLAMMLLAGGVRVQLGDATPQPATEARHVPSECS
jgi:hypothetical protein